MARDKLSREALGKIQALIEANFTGRDELYAAAEALDDAARQKVCCRLAEHLAGHAVELQQIVTAYGVDPAEPLDIHMIAEALFDLAKINRGERGVLETAAESERNLKQDYDEAIDEIADVEAEYVLRRQRNEVELGEQVLKGMSGGEQKRPRGDSC